MKVPYELKCAQRGHTQKYAAVCVNQTWKKLQKAGVPLGAIFLPRENSATKLMINQRIITYIP